MPSEFNDSLLAELQAGLRELESRSQCRTLAEITGVNLCSNDYLGLSDNPALKQTVIEAMFKAFARALRFAVARDQRLRRVLPSTKGLL